MILFVFECVKWIFSKSVEREVLDLLRCVIILRSHVLFAQVSSNELVLIFEFELKEFSENVQQESFHSPDLEE